MTTVYRKTDKGLAEIETRVHGLDWAARSALIMVDGRKTDAELSRLIRADAPAVLARLRAEGFIVAVEAVAERKAAPPPAPRGAGTGFESTRRSAAREINHQLGPLAETLALAIERTKTSAELQPLLVQAVEMLRRLRGAASAEAFAGRFIDGVG